MNRHNLLLIGCLALGASLASGQTPSTPSAAAAQSPEGNFSGKVTETMNAAGYTYILVDTGKAKNWAAAPQFPVKVGDSVAVAAGMPMPKYHSKSLDRDFELVYFTGAVKVNGAVPGSDGTPLDLPKDHPPIAGMKAKPTVDLSGIKKAEGGKSIAEIYAGKAKLKGQPVKVRGRVVKYNANIMGKNWLHIRDGTGDSSSDDLTVTTAAATKVGDMVLVTGNISNDRDFGGNYKYSMMIEDAEVKVE